MDTDYATLLELEMESLLAAAQSSTKDLMQRLKDLGVAKMGVRQRLAQVVKERLNCTTSDMPTTRESGAPAPQPPPGAPRPAGVLPLSCGESRGPG